MSLLQDMCGIRNSASEMVAGKEWEKIKPMVLDASKKGLSYVELVSKLNAATISFLIEAGYGIKAGKKNSAADFCPYTIISLSY